MKSQPKSKLTSGCAALALAAGMLLAVSASAISNISSVCRDQWDVSAASDYCTTTVNRATYLAEVNEFNCSITAHCSLTFSYGSGGASSVTLTPSVTGIDVLRNHVSNLVVCVSETIGNGTHSYWANVGTSCAEGDTTGKQAVEGAFVPAE